jgi:ribosomal protein S18 acetylase RimI-like enzyme
MKSDEQVARAWNRLQENWWAYEQLERVCERQPHRAWRLLGVLSRRATTPMLVRDLGCGPLQDFVRYHAPAYIDEIERRCAENARFRRALKKAYLPKAVDEVSRRLFALGCKPVSGKLAPWQAGHQPMPPPEGALVRKLTVADAAAYVELRAIMLVQEPLAFLASPGDDRASRVEFVRERLADAESAIFGAFSLLATCERAPQLVGAVGVYRHAGPKIAHKIGVWGMFVLPELRGCGLGRELMQHAIAHARSLPDVLQIALSVSDTQPAARGLYESLGFRVWGSEPLALRHAGRVVTEHHLALPVGGDVTGR